MYLIKVEGITLTCNRFVKTKKEAIQNIWALTQMYDVLYYKGQIKNVTVYKAYKNPFKNQVVYQLHFPKSK